MDNKVTLTITFSLDQLKDLSGYTINKEEDWPLIERYIKNSLYDSGFWDTIKLVVETYYEIKETYNNG